MQLPPWLDATNMLSDAREGLPSRIPRPEPLVSPRTASELEAWRKLEAASRERLDAAVREWLTHGRWPADLSATDGYLLSIRIGEAEAWLNARPNGVEWNWEPAAIVEEMLIACWSESFLERHCNRMSWCVASYGCGRESAGSFAA